MTQHTEGVAAFDVEELRSLVAEALELPVSDITDEASFIDDLDLDSLMVMEIMVRLEQHYGVAIDDTDFGDVANFAGARDLLAKKLAQA